jgi:hypothetical protein
MKFLVPLSVNSLGRTDLVGRSVVPLYINPDTFKVTEQKQITNTMTKGGYIIQYWGEQLSTIQVSGTTGSGGIEAINILRDVYRNEIIQFNNILRERSSNQQQEFITAFGSAGNLNRRQQFWSGLVNSFDNLTQNGITNIKTGTQSVIEEIVEVASGVAEQNPTNVDLIPTPGAYATCLILYWHGEKFQGYFTDFNVDESSQSPGHFSYNFSFTVLKRSGTRSNFMPWHRKPVDSNGAPISASLPREGAKIEELSFPVTYTQSRITGYQLNGQDIPPSNSSSITSSFRTNQTGTVDQNNIGINRKNTIKGS